MRNFFKMFSLQFFADGASGEGTVDSASSGETAAAAGQPTGDTTAAAGQEEETQADRLERLGVPKEKAEKYRAKKESRNAANASSVTAAASQDKEEVNGTDDTGSQQDAAASDGQNQQSAEPAKQDWDTLMKDPELNRKMQDTVKARVKPMQDKIDAFQAKIDALMPIVELLGRRYGVDTTDPENVDIRALSKKVGDDDYFYEEESSELGLDVPTAKKRVQQELELNARDRALKQREDALSETIEQMMVRRLKEKQESEASELKKKYKDFDFDKEKQNPVFSRLISPSGGLNIEQAYIAIHYKEIEEAKKEEIARSVAQAFSNSIQSGRQRPAENGMSSRNPSPAPKKLYSQMTEAEKADVKARMKKGENVWNL